MKKPERGRLFHLRRHCTQNTKKYVST